MVTVNKYEDLSDVKKLVEVPEGYALKDCFEGINWDDVVIYVNGYKSDENHVIEKGDIISIKSIPRGVTASLTLLGIALIGVGIYNGYQSYKALKAAEKARQELEALQNATSTSVTNLPYIKGASNSVATGKTQPYVMGTHLFTPYILNSGKNSNYKGYSTIEGANGQTQYYHLVLEGGFNYQHINKISADDVTLMSFDDDNTAQDGVYSFSDSSAFYDENSVIEIRQNGYRDGVLFDTEALNNKIVEETCSDQVALYDEDDQEDDTDQNKQYYTLQPNSMSADVCILFNGLRYYNSSGSPCNRTVQITPQYSLDYAGLEDKSQATWINFGFTQLNEVYSYKAAIYSFEWTARNTLDEVVASQEYWTKVSGDDVDLTDTNNMSYSMTYTKKSYGNYYYYVYSITAVQKVLTGYTETVSNIFTGNTLKQLRYNAHVDFDYEDVKDLDCNITIRLVNFSTDITDSAGGSKYDDCYVQWVHSYIYNAKLSASAGSFVAEKIIEEREASLSTLIGIKVKSTDSNEDKFTKVNVVTSGLARTYDADTDTWSDTKTVTSNPASWLLEVMTSHTHTASQIDESEIDLLSLGELYTYCKENGLEINHVLTDGDTKENVLNIILNVCHSTLYRNIYGLIAVATDKENDSCVALLNEQNLISFEWEKELKRQTDGLKETFIDVDEDYDTNTIEVMYDGSDADDRDSTAVMRSETLTGITSKKQAVKQALYSMYCDKLRRLSVTAKIGNEGLYLSPLDKVKVTHASIKAGLGHAQIAEVTYNSSGNISGLVLYEPIDLSDTDKTYYVTMNCIGHYEDDNGDTVYYDEVITRKIKSTGTETNVVTFSSVIKSSFLYLPCVDNILSYGEGDDFSIDMLIKSIEPNDSNSYQLTLIPYDEQIYTAVEGAEVPSYLPKLSSRSTTATVTEVQAIDTATAELIETVANAVADVTEVVENTEPTFSADVSTLAFKSLSDGSVKRTQSAKISLSCTRDGNTLPLSIDNITLPNGFEYVISGNDVIVKTTVSSVIEAGYCTIDVHTASYDTDTYTDADSNTYSDDVTEYGENTLTDTNQSYYTYSIKIDVSDSGIYLGAFSSIDDISDADIGDYFTYTGDTTESTATLSGKLKQSAIYQYDGLYWFIDDNSTHLASGMSDILSVLDADLASNNSTAYEYLDHLTANSVYTDLLLANTAYIEKLFSTEIFTAKTESITDTLKSYIDSSSVSNYNDIMSALGLDTLDNQTIIDGGYIRTDLINASALVIGSDSLTDILSSFATSSELASAITDTESKISSNTSAVKALADAIGDTDALNGSTIIKGGLVNTSLINADEVLSQKVCMKNNDVSTELSNVLTEALDLELLEAYGATYYTSDTYTFANCFNGGCYIKGTIELGILVNNVYQTSTITLDENSLFDFSISVVTAGTQVLLHFENVLLNDSFCEFVSRTFYTSDSIILTCTGYIYKHSGGVIYSENYNGTIGSGNDIIADGSKGFAIDSKGKVNIADAIIKGEVSASKGVYFSNKIRLGCSYDDDDNYVSYEDLYSAFSTTSLRPTEDKRYFCSGFMQILNTTSYNFFVSSITAVYNSNDGLYTFILYGYEISNTSYTRLEVSSTSIKLYRINNDTAEVELTITSTDQLFLIELYF